MSARRPVRLTITADLQPRSAAHEAQLAALIAQLGDGLRLLGCDVAVTTRESRELRAIVVQAGALVTLRRSAEPEARVA